MLRGELVRRKLQLITDDLAHLDACLEQYPQYVMHVLAYLRRLGG